MSVERRDIVIANALGLHARPAMQFVDLANRFACDITVTKPSDDISVDGKSVMSMITLEATQGTKLTVEASGDDAAAAVEQLAQLVAERFGEDG